MERDIFIIFVYSLVADIMQIIEKTYKFRSRGFPPKLTAAEVIAIEIYGRFAINRKISNNKNQSQSPAALSKPQLSEDIEPHSRSLLKYAKWQQTASISSFG